MVKFIALSNKIKQANGFYTSRRWNLVPSLKLNSKNINKKNSYFSSIQRNLWSNKSNFYKMMTHLLFKDTIMLLNNLINVVKSIMVIIDRRLNYLSWAYSTLNNMNSKRKKSGLKNYNPLCWKLFKNIWLKRNQWY